MERWQTEEREFVPPPEEEKIPSLPVPVDDFNEFSYEDYLNTDEPMKLLTRIQSSYQRERTLTRMDEHAKALGYKRVRKDWSAYTKQQNSMKQRDADNLIEDLPRRYQQLAGVLICGRWSCDSGGVRDERGELICWTPIFPVMRCKDVVTKKEGLELAFRVGNEWGSTTELDSTVFFKRSTIVDALAGRGVAVNSENAGALVRYLSDVRALSKQLPIELVASRCGWTEDKTSFIPFVESVRLVAPTFQALADAITQKGSVSASIALLREARKSIPVRIAIAASFASVLVAPLHVNSFFVHLWSGTSGVGKTVAEEVAASVWGNPRELVCSFNGTTSFLEQRLGFLNHLPLFLDEAQTAKADSLSKTVYDLTEATGRGRARKNGGVRQSATWANVTVSTGETPLTGDGDGAGALNRVISIDCGSRPLFENGNTTVTTARENYGFCGQMFVEGFLGDEQGADKAAGFFDGFTKLLKESGVTSKQQNAAALLLTADALAVEYVYETFRSSERVECLKPEQLLPFLLTEAEVSVGLRAYQYILGCFVKT